MVEFNAGLESRSGPQWRRLRTGGVLWEMFLICALGFTIHSRVSLEIISLEPVAMVVMRERKTKAKNRNLGRNGIERVSVSSRSLCSLGICCCL